MDKPEIAAEKKNESVNNRTLNDALIPYIAISVCLISIGLVIVGFGFTATNKLLGVSTGLFTLISSISLIVTFYTNLWGLIQFSMSTIGVVSLPLFLIIVFLCMGIAY